VTGKSLTVVRDYMTQAKEIVMPNGRRCKIEVDHMVQLEHFVVADDSSTSLKFEYLSSSELLYYKETSSNTTYIYEYDESGRVTEVVYPSGETTIVASDVSNSGAVCSVHACHAADSLTLITNHNELTALHGKWLDMCVCVALR
jgi:YD repeat-containing protein